MDEYAKGPAEGESGQGSVPGESWPPQQPAVAQGQVEPYAQPQQYGRQPYPQQPGYAPPGHAVAAMIIGRKSPALAGILSLFLPGLGQFVNGAPVAGILFLLAWLINLPFVFFLGWLVVPVLVSIGLIAWSCIHAVMGANRYNDQLLARAMTM